MLEIRDLWHRFDQDRWVLEDINLTVDQGQILAVMGSSGGGKTTLLRCISGLITPTQGDITVGDLDVRKDPEGVRNVLGLVFQSAALFDYLTVEENIAFGLSRKRGVSRQACAEKVAEMLKLVHLEGNEKLMPSDLSGGMKKRVGLARALAMSPQVVLYDEPTSGLDPITAYSIDRLIVDTRDELNVTSIVVSHDLSSVFRVADRIAFLDKGKLAFFGTPAEFRDVKHTNIQELVEKARSENLAQSEKFH